jgi:hypothetical protein
MAKLPGPFQGEPRELSPDSEISVLLINEDHKLTGFALSIGDE